MSMTARLPAYSSRTSFAATTSAVPSSAVASTSTSNPSFSPPSPLTSHLSPLTPQPSARACSLDTSRIINHQSPTPVSLRQLIGHDCDRRPILNHILEAFQQRYASLTPHPSPLTPHPSSLHADYLAALYRRTGLHPYRDAHGQFDAEIIDVEPSGHLILRDMSGTIRRYAFKEVEYVKPLS